MSRRGICLIWFRDRHIPPSMLYREAKSVAESSEGPTASKSDRTGRNPGMTRLVRRSSATSGGNVFSIGVDYGTSVLTLCFLSHLRVHYCYVILVKYA